MKTALTGRWFAIRDPERAWQVFSDRRPPGEAVQLKGLMRTFFYGRQLLTNNYTTHKGKAGVRCRRAVHIFPVFQRTVLESH